MKSKIALSFILSVLLLCSMFAGCATGSDEKVTKDITDLYISSKNKDNTYSYSLTDLNGNILFEKDNEAHEPKINTVSDNVYELITQTGTGLSTNWAVYCDVENSKVSESFHYVLGAKDGYVFYVEYEDNIHTIICRNIFDPDALIQEYRVDDELVVLDSFSKADLETEGVAKISYLTGETATEQEYIHIYFGD